MTLERTIMMRFFGNLLWLIFCGLESAIAMTVLGLLLCITVVGIPVGIQCFKIAGLMLLPFGKHIFVCFGKHPIANVIWMILFGWEFALVYALAGLLLCITVVGIPFGLQLFKLAKLFFSPFGAEIQ